MERGPAADAPAAHLAVGSSHASGHVVASHAAALHVGQRPEVARAALGLVALAEVGVHREVVAHAVLPAVVARFVEAEVTPESEHEPGMSTRVSIHFMTLQLLPFLSTSQVLNYVVALNCTIRHSAEITRSPRSP